MRMLLSAGLTASLVSTCFALQPASQKHSQIRGEGCVEPGVETRCLAVKDVRSGAMFELFFKGIQPAIGTGIVFSGEPHHGVTTCNQGIVIDVLSWARRDLKCTQGTAPKPRK